MERVIAFSMERVIAFSIERVLVRNALQLHRNFGVPLAFPQRSISRSICVPVTRSLLGYFCPVLYVHYYALILHCPIRLIIFTILDLRYRRSLSEALEQTLPKVSLDLVDKASKRFCKKANTN